MNPIFSGQGRIVNEKGNGLTYRWSLGKADLLSQRNQQGYAWAFELDALTRNVFQPARAGNTTFGCAE
jgi:hypothetical protein